MKKLYLFFVLSLVLASCEKGVNLSQLDADFVVSTNFDPEADFSTYSTYYIPDNVLIITNNDDPEYWQANNAGQLIDAIVEAMDNAGYSRVTEKEDADLGLQASLVKRTHVIIGQTGNPWWWGYPGYWTPGFWGPWNSWRRPFIVRTSFRTGSFLVEMVDLKTAYSESGSELPVLWNSFMTGLLSGSDNINVQRALQAIDQAFEQSPYIRK